MTAVYYAQLKYYIKLVIINLDFVPVDIHTLFDIDEMDCEYLSPCTISNRLVKFILTMTAHMWTTVISRSRVPLVIISMSQSRDIPMSFSHYATQ